MGMLDAVDRNRAFVGLEQPVQHVHQRCLACPVFTKQAVDFTGRNVQVDRVVRDQVAEPLGDPRSRSLLQAAGAEVGVTSQSCRGLRLGLDRDLAADDVSLERVQLGLQLRRNLGVEFVERRQAGAIVLQGADVGLVGE